MGQTVDLKIDRAAIGQMQKKAQQGLYQMGYDIAASARDLAPYVTGALRNSIRVEPDGDNILIRAGGTVSGAAGSYGKRIDYAVKREEGPNRDPTTEHYMENAERGVFAGDWQNKYFGDIA